MHRCNKSFRQRSGLKYHSKIGKCKFAPNRGSSVPPPMKRSPPQPRVHNLSQVEKNAKDAGKAKNKAKAEDESPIFSDSGPSLLPPLARSSRDTILRDAYPDANATSSSVTSFSNLAQAAIDIHPAVRFSVPLESGWNHVAVHFSSSSSLSGALGEPTQASASAQGGQPTQERPFYVPSQGSTEVSYLASSATEPSPQYDWSTAPFSVNEEQLPPAATIPEYINVPSAPTMFPSAASAHKNVWSNHSTSSVSHDQTQIYAPEAPAYRETTAASSPTLDPWGSQSWPQFQDQNASASSPMTPFSSTYSSPPTVSSSSASTHSISSLTSTPESYDHAPPSPSIQSQTTHGSRRAKTLQAQEMERALANAAALKRASQWAAVSSMTMGATTQKQQPQPPPEVHWQSSQHIPVFAEQQVQEMLPHGMQELSADVVAFVASQISAMRAEAAAQSSSPSSSTTSPTRASHRDGYLLPPRGRPRRSPRSDVSISLPPAPTTAAVPSSSTSTSRHPSHPYLPAAEYRRHTANNSTTSVIESVLPPQPVPIQYPDGYRDLMAEVARVQEIAAVQERDRLEREERERTEKRWGKKRAE
ncbi:hypothetical protein BDN70DRAFT_186354 [Pholiota conissans]|uniref:Uncharacterized protein n=1 Tax=Pholiota conissans TaxID=109636 RepID=A0A9P5YYI5_9AGAR|nr:hypothetical protein BDN70DRAFT_186354 [Pholiota conissans]